jgi:hypothetical protein
MATLIGLFVVKLGTIGLTHSAKTARSPTGSMKIGRILQVAIRKDRSMIYISTFVVGLVIGAIYEHITQPVWMKNREEH